MRVTPTWITLLAISSLAQAQEPEAQKPDPTLRVATLNLWHCRPKLAERTEAVVQLLAEHSPDVVGLQEVSHSLWRPNRARILAERLGYRHLYRPSHGPFTIFTEGLGFLSRTKWQAEGRQILAHSKMWPFERRFVSWLETRLPDGTPYLLFNTHMLSPDTWDWQVERLEQALDVVVTCSEVALARDMPALLVGDMNSVPHHLPMRVLTGTLLMEAPPFVDCWQAVGEGSGYTDAPTEAKKRIDYVLTMTGTTKLLVPQQARLIGGERIVVDPKHPNGVYPSDHQGILVDLVLKSAPIHGLASAVPGATSEPTQASAERARELIDRATRLRDQIRAIRAGVRAEREEKAYDEWDHSESDVLVSDDELRPLVLERVLQLLGD